MVDEPGRRHPDRPIVAVGAVILDGERVLLIQRGREPMKGAWSLPGGAVEVGETLDAALAREVLEETGLSVEVGPVVEVLDRVQFDADGRVEYHYVIIDYLCRVFAGSAASGSDARDVRWVRVDDLGELRVTAKAIAVIQKALERAREKP
ncbi:MAG TPA: NUDIX hydrolase [Vicinamibacterales bacterium]|nr:NUDIX hydrolase [Vicinamibacterales bacterium]